MSLFGEKHWPRRGWAMRPVRRADLIAVANDLTSDMPVDLFGAHDERHPSTVYEYDDDLFTSMRDFDRVKTRDGLPIDAGRIVTIGGRALRLSDSRGAAQVLL